MKPLDARRLGVPRKYAVDDGIEGGQGRSASSLRDGYVILAGVLVAICGMVVIVVWLALR